MNIKILAEYKGEEFELVIGQEYEFCYNKDFTDDHTFRGILERLDFHHGCTSAFRSSSELMSSWFSHIRPIQKQRQLTHKEIAVNLIGQGVFRYKEVCEYWGTSWTDERTIEYWRFCFFSDLDTDHEKWHELTTDLLDMIKEREV